MASIRFSWPNLLLRLAFSALLVLGSYNPSGYSYYHWVADGFPQSLNAISAFVGVILLIGWTVFLRATWNSLGPIGLLLALAFFGTFVWLIIDAGLLAADNMVVLNWIALLVASGVLGVGMSWSHIRRRLSGQFDIDDVEDD